MTKDGALAMKEDNFVQKWELLKEHCKIIIDSKCVPEVGKKGNKRLMNREEVMLIALKAFDMDISLLQALDWCYIIYGKVSTEIQGQLAMVYRKYPNAEIYTIESTERICTMKGKRPGDKEFVEVSFTMEEAHKMGLTNNDMYKDDPKDMLFYRCCGRLLKRKFPDCVAGCYTREEIESFPENDKLPAVKDMKQLPVEKPEPPKGGEIVDAEWTNADLIKDLPKGTPVNPPDSPKPKREKAKEPEIPQPKVESSDSPDITPKIALLRKEIELNITPQNFLGEYVKKLKVIFKDKFGSEFLTKVETYPQYKFIREQVEKDWKEFKWVELEEQQPIPQKDPFEDL